MQPSEILEALSKPFPAAVHKERKLPGGSLYYYVAWEHVVDRLNTLLGLDWSVSYSDPVVSGDYLSLRCCLTIMGVSREGIGTMRTYPALNDEGKEKIIGDPPNNATRDAFWDAAYAFGIGRYLDDQARVREFLQRSDRVNHALRQTKLTKAVVEDLIATNELPDIYGMSNEQCDRLLVLMKASAQSR